MRVSSSHFWAWGWLAAPLLAVGTSGVAVAEADADQPATEDAAAAVELAEDDDEDAMKKESGIIRPTHKQTLIINVNTGDLPQTTLTSFCLSPEGNILAACGNEKGEVRIFDAGGAYLESWELPVKPDAINIGSDGNVYIAGNGKLLRLDTEGKVLLEAESPHAAELLKNEEALRKEIVDQAKQISEQFAQQIEVFDKQIAQLEKKKAEKEEEGEELSAADQARLKSYADMKKQYEDIIEQYGGKEMSDQELAEKVKASMDYKLKVASISETDGKVYIACTAAVGYGFNVWQLDDKFTGGKVVVSELRGCCGQMDVQASKDGIFVAENARHRVACFNDDGKLTTQWGEQARSGIDGFGSCCNPMNVAFGADGSIYTAESESGRVKRFSPKGELIDLVGKVEIVPGCKKVAIAVDKTGDTVFMLDVSRNHIVKMERLAAGETVAYYEQRGEGGSSVGRAILKAFLGN
ncbi:MAG TPA: hypothetical protein VF175_18140 [Lacipirellula sp.]